MTAKEEIWMADWKEELTQEWLRVRDNVNAAAKDGMVHVTDELKAQAGAWFVDAALPWLEATGTSIVTQLQEQAKNETNPWCKARDLIVWPCLIRGGLWLMRNVMAKTLTTANT